MSDIPSVETAAAILAAAEYLKTSGALFELYKKHLKDIKVHKKLIETKI